MYSVKIKSGTSGYYRTNGEDWHIANVPSDNIPCVGDILDLKDEGMNPQKSYLVKEVRRVLQLKTSITEFGEAINVYVVKCRVEK